MAKIMRQSNTEQPPHHIQYIIGEWLAIYRSNTFQISHWPQPHYPLTPPKKGRHSNMLKLKGNPHSQTHPLKL